MTGSSADAARSGASGCGRGAGTEEFDGAPSARTAPTVAATTPADRGRSEGRRTGSTRRWRPRGTSALLTKLDLPALSAVIHPGTHPIG